MNAYFLTGQLITFAAQCAYVFAFREAFERQSGVLRERPGRCALIGLGVAAFWTLVGYGAFHLAGANRSPWLLILLSVPLYLATTAGGAVCLATLASRALKREVSQNPYLWVALGQIAAILVGRLPYVGMPATTLYACAGIGAVAYAEYTAGKEGRELPRLGLAGLASMLVLTAAISAGLVRAGRRVAQEQPPMPSMPPPPPPGQRAAP